MDSDLIVQIIKSSANICGVKLTCVLADYIPVNIRSS